LNLGFFKQGLDERGYQEGRHYFIEARFADADRRQLPALAKELVDLGVDVIVTIGSATTRAAKKATVTMPIVMTGSANPVEGGIVMSLSHPSGNVTGLAHSASPEIAGKGLQLLKEAAPQISRVAVLVGIVNNNHYIDILRPAAEHLDITLLVHELKDVKSAADYDSILASIIAERADAIFAFPEFITYKYHDALMRFISTTYPVPTMFQDFTYIEKGGLISYYANFYDLRRQSAEYVDKILKGAKPADLPVRQPSRVELVVNLKTAKMLGLTIPQSILGFADRIVE
jgi:putative ABC transport system substrate-binding protein